MTILPPARLSPIVDLTRKVVGGVEKTRDRVLTDDEIRLLCSTDRHADLFRFLNRAKKILPG